MVLELKVPHGEDLAALGGLWPVFLSYILSFLYVGIYWNNHHHLLHTVKHVNGSILWANMLLLFWLSLFPFTSAWMGENHFGTWPVAIYGAVLLFAALSYTLLEWCIVRAQGPGSLLAKAIGKDWKGKISIIAYVAAAALAFVSPWIACAIFAGVALMWLVPDRRIEKLIGG